jgi:hypothetical protein
VLLLSPQLRSIAVIDTLGQDQFIAKYGAGVKGRAEPKLTPPRKLQL